MMIAMMTLVLLCFRISVLMTCNAAYLHGHHDMQDSHEIEQRIFSSGLSRKLMLKQAVEGYRDQDLEFRNDLKKPPLGELHKGEEMMVTEAQGSDPTSFTSMDYTHVRRRRPIHNKSPKPNNSP